VTAHLLVVEGLTAGYAEPVVGPLSFSIAVGEVVGVWGPNGCGKSTLLNALADGARVFAGRVSRAAGLSIGYLEQRSRHPGEVPLTGRELLAFAGARRHPPDRLAGWLDWRIDRLSGGQYQLLSVWAVLGGEADLVLLDEPTNNLDPSAESILAQILAAEQGRRSVLMVSHERDFLDRACDRVLDLSTTNSKGPRMNANGRE
jgi:zinc transport system ATP-binding protein